MSEVNNPLDGLTAAVQYKRKDCFVWRTMAAFDVLEPAEKYLAQQDTTDSCPWEYRLIDIAQTSALSNEAKT
jgi:hypothetical protein